MNPLEHLLPALFLALNSPAKPEFELPDKLEWAGQEVPVNEHFDSAQPGHYVEIDQPGDTDAGGAAGCKRYSCTVLLNVVTQFDGVVTSLPVESLVSQINARLRGQRLTLPEGWDCGPGDVTALQVKETDGKRPAVRRLLRYRWDVFYHS
jgi:hypothetical protein